MNTKTGQKTIRVIIAVLAVLLTFSASALVGAVLCRQARQSRTEAAVVPDNVITAEEMVALPAYRLTTLSHSAAAPMQAASLSSLVPVDRASGEQVELKLYRDHAETTTPFQVDNMFPGDAETKSYTLEISYRGSVTVYFQAAVRSGYEKLAEVLQCRVALQDGTVLYDGLMGDMPWLSQSLSNANGGRERLVYEITVWLDTSVGNEYMAKELYADFRWWVPEEDAGQSGGAVKPGQPGDSGNTDQPDGPDQSGDTGQPDGTGELLPPYTGDDSHVELWLTLAVLSLLCILLLLRSCRKDRKQEDSHHGG